MGFNRIKRNLALNTDVIVEFCKKQIASKKCKIYKCGKNWYSENNNIIITVNSFGYTIITAHIKSY